MHSISQKEEGKDEKGGVGGCMCSKFPMLDLPLGMFEEMNV